MDFCCRECSAVIIEKGSVKGWRDLPSENWAEMMDFWHCHKPDVPQANGASGHDLGGSIDESSVNRGYGADTIFAPTRGLGFVDLTTFLLVELDCTNIEVRYGIPFLFSYCLQSLWKLQRVSRRWPSLLLLFNGLVTDTNTQDQYSVTNHCSAAVIQAYPLLLIMGYLFDWRSLASAFHSVSSSRSWKPWD